MVLTEDELKAMRQKYRHIEDDYEAWKAAGKPQPVKLWPFLNGRPVLKNAPPIVPGRGSGNVMNRIATRRGRGGRQR